MKSGCTRGARSSRATLMSGPWALIACGVLAGALSSTGGCSRGAHPRPTAPVAETSEGAASLAGRLAWAAGLAQRADLGPERLEDLAHRGFYEAHVCPTEERGWTLAPGQPLAGYRIVWSCPQCSRTSPSPTGQAGEAHEPAVPPATERPWPAKALVAAQVAREATDILARWGEVGYPLGRARPSAHVASGLLVVKIDAHPGPRVRVGGLSFEGNRTTRSGYLLRLLGWEGDELYRASRWEAARGALLGSGLFDEVEGPLLVRPRGVEPQPDSLRGELRYRLRERRVSSFTGLAGYSGKDGNLSGFVNLELGNLFGTGRRVRVLWRAQRERDSRFELAWHEPYVWRLPVSADLELTHALEDTLYAETSWGLDLGMPAGMGWIVRAGWNWRRLVLGAESDEDRRRQTARFGVRRGHVLGTLAPRGWELQLDLAATRDAEVTLHQGQARVRGWVSGRGLMLSVEERAGLVAGADSVLRGDALSVGGASSLRGYFETAYRATRCVVQRVEVGPAASPAGTRFYVLLDLGWWREWRQSHAGIFGTGAGNVFRWSAGLGLRTPARAGDLYLDYAVPGGEPVWRGRLHFGLVSRF